MARENNNRRRRSEERPNSIYLNVETVFDGLPFDARLTMSFVNGNGTNEVITNDYLAVFSGVMAMTRSLAQITRERGILLAEGTLERLSNINFNPLDDFSNLRRTLFRDVFSDYFLIFPNRDFVINLPNLIFSNLFKQKNKISKEELKNLKVIKFNGKEKFSCPICYVDVKTGTRLRHLNCSHKFHVKCIDSWLIKSSGTCPVCRADVYAMV